MADLPAIKSSLSLFKDMKSKLTQRTNLTNFSSDSAVRALLDSVIVEDINLRNEARAALLANQIGAAQGSDLEAIGIERLPRLKPTFAEVTISEECLAFWTDTTFGAINGGGSFSIPAGTLISIPQTPSGETLVSFLTTSSVTANAANNIVFASAKATSLGSAYNVRSGALTVHNFTSYSDFSNNSLKVTNYYPILNGRDLENIESYRYRLSNYFSSLTGSNNIKLKLTALSVPGVVDIRIIPGYYGIGSVAIVVFGAEGESNASIVQDVQRRLMSVQTGGIKAIAIPGIRVSFDFDMNLIVTSNPTTEQRRLIAGNIRRTLQSRLRDEDSRSYIDLESLRKFILSENSSLLGILSKSSRRTESLFDGVYVRRSHATELLSSEREKLTSNIYSLEEDEFASIGTVNITFEVRG